jgi:5-methylcytosine-specific restriction protein A
MKIKYIKDIITDFWGGVVMLLIKNSAGTMQGVLENAMHATEGKPQTVKKGDIILIAQTKTTLKPGEKPIRWVMDFVSCEEDEKDLTTKIWERKWRYIITGENLRSVEPFDIMDIKLSSKDYNAVQTHCKVELEDEEIILDWISNINNISDGNETGIISKEFANNKELSDEEYIQKLDKEYGGIPEFKEKVVRSIQRPSALSNAIKEKQGYVCALCNYPGFIKKSGEKYAETHHMLELNKKAPKTLQSGNVIVVYPTCHKKLHYGNTKTEYLDPGWKIAIDDEVYYLE